ncbi:hypothetical protein [Methanobrevibacter sp.]|uniref:hypothetical protein n=1 Tax=Methanobrevibacter sp. TaxID=66852 RepID=UPI003869BA4A
MEKECSVKQAWKCIPKRPVRSSGHALACPVDEMTAEQSVVCLYRKTLTFSP